METTAQMNLPPLRTRNPSRTMSDISPQRSVNVTAPPFTAPRSSPLDERKVAAVTPENQLDTVDDKSKHKRPKRAAASKPFPPQSGIKLPPHGQCGRSKGHAPVSHYPSGGQHPIGMYPVRHAPTHYVPFPLPNTLTNLQQNQGDSTSLASLTVRFVELLNRVSHPYGNGELDLNIAMDNLGVQKRRLYDVTNVLEGIGLIKKENKNNVSWANRDGDSKSAHQKKISSVAIEKEILSYKLQSEQLDKYIEQLSEQVRDYTLSRSSPSDNDGNASSNLYVTKREISALQNYARDTVIAIRAPSGTSLEVPNPDEGMRPGMRRFQIYLTSPSENAEQVNVYLVQHGKNDRPVQRDSHMQHQQQQHPKPNWDSQNGPPTSRGHSSQRTYPMQEQRPRHEAAGHTVEQVKSEANSAAPKLPLPDSLPKFLSPIESKSSNGRRQQNSGSVSKPDTCHSKQPITHSAPRSSSTPRRPALKRRKSEQEYSNYLAPENPTVSKPEADHHAMSNKKVKLIDACRPASPTIDHSKMPPLPVNEPLTPRAPLGGPSPSNQSSFDLLNAPLNSPSAFLASPAAYLASPAMSRSINSNLGMTGMSSSLLTTSPFAFSPNFQPGELSPFLPTPTALRLDNRFCSDRERPDKRGKLPTLF